MKTKMLAACMLAAITLGALSCDLFSKKEVPASLTGKWQVVNVADSSIAGLGGRSFFQGFEPDTAKAVFTFYADSSLVYTSAEKPTGDTAKYYIDSTKSAIILRGSSDSKNDTFAIKIFNDTLLQVFTDSVYFKLKKIQ